MKDNLKRDKVKDFPWIDTKMMLAGILTKDSKSDLLMDVLRIGEMPQHY